MQRYFHAHIEGRTGNQSLNDKKGNTRFTGPAHY